jgi:hypothetical protein
MPSPRRTAARSTEPASDYGPTRWANGRLVPQRQDVEITDRPDVADPHRTVRGAQRVPGYHRLWREGSITDEQREAADRYRDLAERASGACWRPDRPPVRQPGQGYGPSEMQIDAEHELRRARDAIGRHGRRVADMIAIAGLTLEDIGSSLSQSRHVARGAVLAVLERLVEHWQLDA